MLASISGHAGRVLAPILRFLWGYDFNLDVLQKKQKLNSFQILSNVQPIIYYTKIYFFFSLFFY